MLPSSLITSLTGLPGFQEEAFKAVHASGEQVTSLRLHPVKGRHCQWNEEGGIVPWCRYGRYLSERPSFTLDPCIHAGAYYVQDASSMFLWQALQQLVPDAGKQIVLDLCAAPGGKSTLLASYFQDGLLVSNEVIKQRAAILVENMTKWGSGRTVVTNNDPAHFQSLGEFFDVMVVDAPCSGSGLFRKDPAAIEEWSEEAVALCSQRQQRILADVLPSLKTNGLLIYATCSYSSEEDEAIADWLVREQDMESVSVELSDDWGIVTSLSPGTQAVGYRFYPYRLQGEGFFLAAFRKKGSTTAAVYRGGRATQLPLATKTELQSLQHWIDVSDQYVVFKQQEVFRLFPQDFWEALQHLSAHLYIRKAGIALGSLKGKDLVPDHELALSEAQPHRFNRVALSYEEALTYLRRQDLSLQAPAGWNLLTYQSLPLGWAKVLPNRINNYYPQEWRIRMG